MTHETPQDIVAEMQEYAESIALDMLQDMDDEECVLMIRDFCRVMAEWQPTIRGHVDSPVMLGISCLTTAKLFTMAFGKAYCYTDKKVNAMEAIRKALGDKGVGQ